MGATISSATWASVILMSISTSLDNFSVSVSYAISKKKFSKSAMFFICVISGGSAVGPMFCGNFINKVLPASIPGILAACIFFVLGLFDLSRFVQGCFFHSNDHDVDEDLLCDDNVRLKDEVLMGRIVSNNDNGGNFITSSHKGNGNGLKDKGKKLTTMQRESTLDTEIDDGYSSGHSSHSSRSNSRHHLSSQSLPALLNNNSSTCGNDNYYLTKSDSIIISSDGDERECNDNDNDDNDDDEDSDSDSDIDIEMGSDIGVEFLEDVRGTPFNNEFGMGDNHIATQTLVHSSSSSSLFSNSNINSNYRSNVNDNDNDDNEILYHGAEYVQGYVINVDQKLNARVSFTADSSEDLFCSKHARLTTKQKCNKNITTTTTTNGRNCETVAIATNSDKHEMDKNDNDNVDSYVSLNGVILLSVACSFSNIAGGIAAGVAGYPVIPVAFGSFIFTLFFILVGQYAGLFLSRFIPEKYILCASGLGLIGIGMENLVSTLGL